MLGGVGVCVFVCPSSNAIEGQQVMVVGVLVMVVGDSGGSSLKPMVSA